MKAFWEYIRAFTRDWVTLMSGIASVILAVLGALLSTPLPRWAFWLSAAVCLLVASFRVWKREWHGAQDFAKNSPQVVIEGISDTGFLFLNNQGNAAAYNIHVDNLQTDTHVAKFSPVTLLAPNGRETIGVEVTTRPNGNYGPSLIGVFEDAWPEADVNTGTVSFPLVVTYNDIEGRRYRTEHEARYAFKSRTLRFTLKSFRRESDRT